MAESQYPKTEALFDYLRELLGNPTYDDWNHFKAEDSAKCDFLWGRSRGIARSKGPPARLRVLSLLAEVREIKGRGYGLHLHSIARYTYPTVLYCPAWKQSSNGGPPGVYMPLSRMLHDMYYDHKLVAKCGITDVFGEDLGWSITSQGLEAYAVLLDKEQKLIAKRKARDARRKKAEQWPV